MKMMLRVLFSVSLLVSAMICRNIEAEKDEVTRDDVTKEINAIENLLRKVKKDVAHDEFAKILKTRKRNVAEPKQNNPLRTYDYKKENDPSIPFTYTGYVHCTEEGSEGSKNNLVKLCKTCYRTVDYGETMRPQYMSSVECDNNAPNCLSGAGKCLQKVIYVPFQKLTDGPNNTWEDFQMAVNTSCECECVKDSIIHTHFVGSSN